MKRLKRIVAILLVIALNAGVFATIEPHEVLAADYCATMDFSSGSPVGTNMQFVNEGNSSAEAYTTVVNINGTYGRKIDNNYYAYFKVDSSTITQDEHDLFIEVTFWDEGTDWFQVQYNATDSQNYKQAVINKTATNQWVTTTVCLSDVSFRKAQNGGCDFRIWGRGTTGTIIKDIKIKKQAVNPDAEPLGKRYGGSSYSEFLGKTVAGYQAWFATGDRYSGWTHWNGGTNEADGTSWPRLNNHSFDVYPDISEYAADSLAQTGYENLGSGEPAKLFDSSKRDVINTHFRWMKEYGIDGAAVQRFTPSIVGRSITNTVDGVNLVKIKEAAEANQRLFYVMYDISGGPVDSYVDNIKFDWVYNVEQSYELLNSPAYATVNGKPVVCIWGFGVGADTNEIGRDHDPANYQKLIDFFRARDCYIVLGTNDNWRTQSQYTHIWNQADMISPWYVGRFGDNNGVDNFYNNNLVPDIQYCNENGLEYYPVVFSGFSWGTWKNGSVNAIPRRQGDFFWHQAYKLKEYGLKSFYIAMFDEYDEGTAIMKNASDYFDIPTDQYFVTASADGYWLSSDFQLRVAQAAIKMVKGEIAATPTVPVAHSEGPIYYRNSFESRYVQHVDSNYSGVYPVDPCFKNDTQISASNVSATTKINTSDSAKTGDYVASISGTANSSNSSYVYKIADTDITIKEGMKLSYSVKAINDLGRNTYVELICSDGTYISTKGASTDGVSMGAGSAKGNVGNWTDYTFTFGTSSLVDKKITGIALCYSGTSGSFSADYDNIIILTDGSSAPSDDPIVPDNDSEYYAGNPIISHMFTADPSAHVWEANGKLYIYASHDVFPSKGCDLMDKYHVFSTTNMVTWTDEGEILSSDDVSWGRPEGGFMWAPDAALVNGTYYFYFPHPTGSGDSWNSTWRIGVATSNQPASGFTCADDGYVKTKDGEPYVTGIDPCIFKDDDGTYYLYTGGGAKCTVAKMSSDMVTLAEDPVDITSTLTDFHEGMWVFKRNGIYYAMYADNTAGENLMRYSTANSPYGPWTEGGIVLDGTGCDTTHGSIVEYKGHWYLFYHNCEISGNGTLRSVCVDEVFFNEDGSIEKVVQTKQGVAAVDTVDPSQLGTSTNPDPSKFTQKTDYSITNATITGGATLASDCIQNLHLEGASVEWNNVNGGNGGQAMITVTYGTPDGATALVNTSGDSSGGITGEGYFLKFDKTTGWSDYSGVATCFVDLNPGTDNTVKFTCGMGGVNITGMSVSLYDGPVEDDSDTITIVSQPQSVTANDGDTAAFTVVATGNVTGYQWQAKAPSGSWKNLASSVQGYNQATLYMGAIEARNGYQYRCVVKGENGNVVTDAVTLTVISGVTITSQPQDVYIGVNGMAVFTVEVTGNVKSYQWQSKTPTGSWKNASSAVAGYNEAIMSIPAIKARDGYQFRCVVKDENGKNTITEVATLTINPDAALTITSQPKSVEVTAGTKASFSVGAKGEGLFYLWQYRTSSTAGWNYCASTTEGYNTATITVDAAAANNGYQYRCVIANSDGAVLTSNAAKLTVR